MSKKLFDKRFVYFLWEDSLEGKRVFFEDNIGLLMNNVNRGLDVEEIVIKSKNISFPFCDIKSACNYKFCYYDPNYKCKRAYNEGKQIQISADGETWVDWEDDHDPDWDSLFEFRIKPEEPKSRRMTCRELAEWIAKGNGQYSVGDNKYTSFYYDVEDDKECSENYKIRRWGSDEWIEPTIDVYNADCKKEEE